MEPRDNLSEDVLSLPGPYSNFLTFYAGPSASSAESVLCINMRFSMIEMKIFFHILLTTFSFADTDKKSTKSTVLTRPYVSGQFKRGSQRPLLVRPLVSTAAS
jgi:hypothetical protein